MSLKAFHLFFIIIAALLAVGQGFWYLEQTSAWHIGIAWTSFAVSAALIFYAFRFAKKMGMWTRSKSILAALALLGSQGSWMQEAQACATCFGAPDDPMTVATRWAVWALVGITAGVLASFSTFFLVLWHRSKKENLAS